MPFKKIFPFRIETDLCRDDHGQKKRGVRLVYSN